MPSACALAVSLAEPRASWLVWFALLPLFAAIRMLPPVRAMLVGAVWGLCVYVFSVTAVDTSLSPGLGSLALLSAIPAVYVYLAALLTRWIGFTPLVLAVGWIGVELAFTPLTLGNGLLASAHGDGVLIDSVGRLLGYVFVAFMVACANASLLGVLSNAHLNIPRQPFFGRLPDVGACLSSQTTLCFQLSALRQTYPRAPPI